MSFCYLATKSGMYSESRNHSQWELTRDGCGCGPVCLIRQRSRLLTVEETECVLCNLHSISLLVVAGGRVVTPYDLSNKYVQRVLNTLYLHSTVFIKLFGMIFQGRQHWLRPTSRFKQTFVNLILLMCLKNVSRKCKL